MANRDEGKNSNQTVVDILDDLDLVAKGVDDLGSEFEKLLLSYAVTLNGSLPDSIEKWKEVSWTTLCTSLEDQAVEYATLKEEYVKRRKTLAASVKSFINRFIETEIDSVAHEEWKNQSRLLIEQFKTEYDYLAKINKLTEGTFLSTLKLIQHAPDPLKVLEDSASFITKCRNIILSQNTLFKRLLDAVSRRSDHSQFDEAKLSEIIHTRTIEMKSHYETAIRDREQAIRQSFEKQQLEMQRNFDDILSRKDDELASLLQSLRNQEQQHMTIQQNETLLKQEYEKRYQLELKNQQLQNENNDLKHNCDVMQSKLNELQIYSTSLELKCQSLFHEKQENDKKSELQINSCKTLVAKLEEDLLQRPPVDLSALSTKLGLFVLDGNSSHVQSSQTGDEESGSGVEEKEEGSRVKRPMRTWSEVEALVSQLVRSSQAEATRCRVEKESLQSQVEAVQKEVEGIRAKMMDKETLIERLERDLMSAHNMIEENKNKMKEILSKKNQTSIIGRHRDVENLNTSADKLIVRNDNDEWEDIVRDSMDSKSNLMHSSQDTKTIAEDMHMRRTSTPNINRQNSSENTIQSKDLQFSERSADEDNADRMLHAVQHQRDRYLRLARDREQEVLAAQKKVQDLEHQYATVREENAELFRRLRMLRVSYSLTAQSNGRNKKSSSHPHSRYEGTDEDELEYLEGGEGGFRDALESKYLQQYEKNLDPFQLEEIERRLVLNRMNFFEKNLSVVTRFLMQDWWTRHALLLYLLLLHLFAIGYLYQVLNPELVQEVDQLHNSWKSSSSSDVQR